MTIQIGQPLPSLALTVIEAGAIVQRPAAELWSVPRLVLFGMPGAFTPTCSERHLPGYVQQLGAFRERGIAVYGVAVNDAHVMLAWAQAQGVPSDLLLIADGNAALIQALGLAMDRSDYGMGIRARRFALYAEDGIVRQLAIEHPGELRVSTAEAMLASLSA